LQGWTINNYIAEAVELFAAAAPAHAAAAAACQAIPWSHTFRSDAGNRKNELASMDFLFDFLYIMGSISMLSGRSQVQVYYCAHYKRRGT